jgi:hypothetical protein
VRVELRKGLRAVIDGMPANQRPLVRVWLSENGYGDLSGLDAEQLEKAISIAAGWPDSVGAELQPEPPTVDAEVVDGDGLPF